MLCSVMQTNDENSTTSLVMQHLMVVPAVAGGFDFSRIWIWEISLEIFLEISLAADPEDVANDGPMKGQNLRTSVRNYIRRSCIWL